MTASYCPPLDGLTFFAGKVTRYSPTLKGECNQSFSLGQGQYASSTVYALGRGKKESIYPKTISRTVPVEGSLKVR